MKKIFVITALFNLLIWAIWFVCYLSFISPTLTNYTKPTTFDDAAQERVYTELSTYYKNNTRFNFIDRRPVFAAMMLKSPDLMESFTEYYRENEAAFAENEVAPGVWNFEDQFDGPDYTIWKNSDSMNFRIEANPTANLDETGLLWWNLSKRMVLLSTLSTFLQVLSLTSLMLAHVSWLFFSQEKKKRRPIFLAFYALFNVGFFTMFHYGLSQSGGGFEYGLLFLLPFLLLLLPFHFAFKKSSALALATLSCLYLLSIFWVFLLLASAY